MNLQFLLSGIISVIRFWVGFQSSELGIEVLGMNPVLRHVLAGILIVGIYASAPQVVRGQDSAEVEEAVDDEPGESQSPLVVEPKTPEELFDAVLLMVDISRNKAARQYLKKFLDDNPTDELLIKLREIHGPAAFLRLANIAELQPESKELLDRNNLAFTKYANDPARLDQFLKDLVSGTTNERTIARHQMETAGVAVVPALISALGDPKYAESQTTLVEVLIRIGVPAAPALHAALVSPDLKTRQAAILALGLIRDPASIPHLLRFAGQPEPTEESEGAKKAISRIVGGDANARVQFQGAASRLLAAAREHYLGNYRWRVGSDQLVSVWLWHQPINTVQERRMTPEAGSRQQGLFFAKAALEIAPDRVDIQTTYLNLLLADEFATTGLGKPVKFGPGSAHDLACSLGAEPVNRALSDALEQHKVDSILVALSALAKVGTVQQIRTVSGKQSAIQRALNFPSHRVQFATAETIVALDPPSRYPGADRVVAILGRALTQAENTQKPAMVLDSVTDRGQTISGFLKDLTFNPTHRRTGREGFLVATTTQELELILLDANIQRWALSETLSNLKYDPRTMDVPVVIYGETIQEATVRVYMKQFPHVYYMEVPANSDDLRRQLTPILQRQAEPPLTAEERSTRSSRAAELLSHLSLGQRRKLYDFTQIENPVLTSLQNTQLAEALLPVANCLPSVAAQDRIAQVASDEGQSNQVRAIAARQMISHIRQFGLLISKEQLRSLRSSWEQTTDPKLYSELSAVMGALKPNTALVGRRLLNVPAEPAPEAVNP